MPDFEVRVMATGEKPIIVAVLDPIRQEKLLILRPETEMTFHKAVAGIGMSSSIMVSKNSPLLFLLFSVPPAYLLMTDTKRIRHVLFILLYSGICGTSWDCNRAVHSRPDIEVYVKGVALDLCICDYHVIFPFGEKGEVS